MMYFLGAAALLATTIYAQDYSQDNCLNDGGNYYCNLVNAITYTSVGGDGSYNKVTSMDPTTGACTNEPFGYSGSLSPLNEEVSLHHRGPLNLKQFAAYTPGQATTRKRKRSEHFRQHIHGHGHNHPRYVHEARSPTPQDSAEPSNGWGRNAYYNAENETAEGLVFLNYFGGSGSGTFDYNFGTSLSYASTDGLSGADSPQILQDTTLPSSAEVVIMTDQKCEDDACGYTRPGTVAHHGFDGAQKAFFFEFSMPDSGESSVDIYEPVNMPAIWMLNAQIPRTLQYGNEECSCWSSGCGELDMFEVLAPGDTRAKSTLHGNKAGGDSNYFSRPVDAPIKIGMILYDDNIHIKILDSSVDFASIMDTSIIEDILGSTSTASDTVSLFSLANAASG